jgi:chemotaxis signal transduction protein
VVASTDPALPPGVTLPFGVDDAIAEHAGARYAVARVAATGYREFKRSDGYDNRVCAVVGLRLGDADPRRTSLQDTPLVALPTAARAQSQEFALFSVGAGRYGIPAGRVIEARPKAGLVRARVGAPMLAGLLEVPDAGATRVIPVVDARALFGVTRPPREQDGVVLVVGSADAPRCVAFGILVDDVSTVLDVGPEHLQPAPGGLRSHAPYLVGLIKLGTGEPLAGHALAEWIDPDVVGDLVVPARAAVAA